MAHRICSPEYERFPRLFDAFDSVPGLTWPTMVFEQQMTLWLGALEVNIMHPGAGHTKGDTIVWVPAEKVLFSGDLVEADAACYTGDAQLAEWPATLDVLAALGAEKMVPGRGPALVGTERVQSGLAYTRDFVGTLPGLGPGGGGTEYESQAGHGPLPQGPWTPSSVRCSSMSTACRLM